MPYGKTKDLVCKRAEIVYMCAHDRGNGCRQFWSGFFLKILLISAAAAAAVAGGGTVLLDRSDVAERNLWSLPCVLSQKY